MFNNGLPASNSSDMRLNKIAGCFGRRARGGGNKSGQLRHYQPVSTAKDIIISFGLVHASWIILFQASTGESPARRPEGPLPPGTVGAPGGGPRVRTAPRKDSLCFQPHFLGLSEKSRAEAPARDGGRSKRGYEIL